MKVDHCLKNCDGVHEHGRDHDRDHDCDLDDDDVEMISVKFSVYLNLWFVTVVRSMPSARFVCDAPYRAYPHSVQTPPKSMNALSFVTQHAV